MAEYVRFVSYLYEYQGNERKKNVGFVRYEVRAGQKRLMVSVNGVRWPDERIPVYAFYREMDSCIGVQLGTLVLRGGRGSFQYSTYADGPGEAEPECRFEEIAGVMVMGEADTPVFCTVWDNEPFAVSGFVRCRMDLVRIRAMKQVREAGQAAKAEEPHTEEAISQQQMSDTPMKDDLVQRQTTVPEGEEAVRQEEAVPAEEVIAQQDKTVAENEDSAVQETAVCMECENFVQQEDGMKQNIPQEQPDAKSCDAQVSDEQQEHDSPSGKDDSAEPVSDTADEEKTVDQSGRIYESYALYRQTLWERMCKLYPKVMPFPYNCQIRALRIRPGDIGRLPKENWPLANNSFMLHGFFQYRYILLLRLPAETAEYEERYMIAVPGVYSQMDNYLADMFGFHEFLGSPKQGSENGRFGYWMQEVRMEQGT